MVAAGPTGRGGRVSGEGGTVNDLFAGDVAERLRVLLDAVEAGDIEADLDHTTDLRGAADALAMVTNQPTDQPSDQR